MRSFVARWPTRLQSRIASFSSSVANRLPACGSAWKCAMKSVNSVLSRYRATIFTVMSALASQHGAVNLGQGFPDDEGPESIRRYAAETVLEGPNQYPPMRGLAELRQVVAEHDRRFYGLEVDWQTEVLVTSGATEALADCFLGLCWSRVTRSC